MISAHRIAFQPKSTKTPFDDSLDKIIINAEIKMKEFISQKEAINEDTKLMAGKNGVLEKSIDFLLKEIKEKELTLESLAEEFKKAEKEIEMKDADIKGKLKEALDKEANYKKDINSINAKLNTVKNGTISELSSQKFEVKKKTEELIMEKYANALLMDRKYRLERELYELEIAYEDSKVNNHTNALKVDSGVKMINQLYE